MWNMLFIQHTGDDVKTINRTVENLPSKIELELNCPLSDHSFNTFCIWTNASQLECLVQSTFLGLVSGDIQYFEILVAMAAVSRAISSQWLSLRRHVFQLYIFLPKHLRQPRILLSPDVASFFVASANIDQSRRMSSTMITTDRLATRPTAVPLQCT